MKITKIEKKAICFAEKYLYEIAIIGITLVAIVIRLLFRGKVSDDVTEYLLPWYEELKTLKFSGLSKQIGDYNILYQTLIVLFTYIPIKAIYVIKAFSCVFDFLLAGLTSWIIYRNEDENRHLKAVIIYAAVLLSPIVFLNSSYWAQCDAIYTFFCLLSVYLIFKEKDIAGFIFYGVAMEFKLQSIFLLPILIFIYIYKKRFTVLNFLIIPLVMLILSLPGIIMGRSILDAFSIYASQTTSTKNMALNYPSFWLILRNQNLDNYYHSFSRVAILLTFVIIAIYLLVWLKNKVRISYKSIMAMAFIISYTCVLFLPAMHERYAFICEIIALLLAVFYRKTIPLLILLYTTTLVTYGNFLFHNKIDLYIFAFLNLFIYVCYSLYLNSRILEDTDDTVLPEK